MKRLFPILFLLGCGGVDPATINQDGDHLDDLAVGRDGDVTSDLAGAPDLGARPDLSSIGPFTCGTQPRSLATDVKPIVIGCSGEMCHGLQATSAQSIYSWWVNKTGQMQCPDGRKLVAPGDPEHSYVIDKLSNRNLCSGEPMPKSFGGQWMPLASSKIQVIYDWICQGAKNN